MKQGIDTAATITEKAAKTLKQEGYSFVGRYLVPTEGGTAWKALRPSEAKTIHNAGLSILLCWETTASRAKAGGGAGSADGKAARELAKSMGVPDGSTIFFAVDYDAPRWDFEALTAYFQAARAAAMPYVAGVYGSKKVLDAVCPATGVKGWQCVAWSYGQTSEYLDFYQYQWQGGAEAKALAAKLGFDVDLDRGETLDGLWNPEQKQPWYADTVRWAEKEGIIAPVSSIEDARPEDPATRAEVMQMLRNYNKRFESEDEFSIGTKG